MSRVTEKCNTIPQPVPWYMVSTYGLIKKVYFEIITICVWAGADSYVKVYEFKNLFKN